MEQVKFKKDPLFQEAYNYRNNYDYPNALATLHRLDTKYPKNILINYLLASTYLESHNIDPALNYCNKVLKLNIINKEALELMGIILKREKKYLEAEEYLLKALEQDTQMYTTRMHLASLYYFLLKNYDKGNEQCEYILTHQYTNRDNFTKKDKVKILSWLLDLTSLYRWGLIMQKRYLAAADILNYDILFTAGINDTLPYEVDEIMLYQLYYLSLDNEKIEQQKERLRELYNIQESEFELFQKNAKAHVHSFQEDKEPDFIYMK